MSQIKYILYSLVILMVLVCSYAVIKPLVQTEWVSSSAKDTAMEDGGSCGFVTYDESKIKHLVGKTLFQANCATCHAVAKNLTGPALADVEKRGPWTKRKNLIRWVKNPEAFIPRTNYTRNLAKEYHGMVMPSFTGLKDWEINEIFDYIREVNTAMKNL